MAYVLSKVSEGLKENLELPILTFFVFFMLTYNIMMLHFIFVLDIVVCVEHNRYIKKFVQ